MSKHPQVQLAQIRTLARVEFKRRYWHVQFAEFGMWVQVSPEARFEGLPVGRNEVSAAWVAARCLEGLPVKRSLPVLRKALGDHREAQRWAIRKLGIEETGRHSVDLAAARARLEELFGNPEGLESGTR
ncbi:MAG TPA: hypothetical protein VD994_17540 [Prosthecobacter sp.]|nr:hypothetical protein [Prosthecobacter sp.]